MSTITIIQGNSNDKDNTRAYMVKGEAGATISEIEKTSTQGLVDTYTITLSDGRTQTFEVTNGKTIVSITKTSTQGLVDTYTITFNDNTTQTFTVTNGEDGVSPTATVSKSNAVTTITITDKTGTTTAQINDAVGYEVPTNSVIGWDSSNPIPNGYEESNIPVFDPQMICCQLNADVTTNTSDYSDVTNWQLVNSVGSAFSIYGGKVKVGSGVNKIKVTVKIRAYHNGLEGLYSFIRKNDTSPAETWIIDDVNGYQTIYNQAMLNVQENDLITINAYGNNIVLQVNSTTMIVEKIS